MLLDILQQSGLTQKQSKVYLALLELGSSPVTRISTKSGVNRSSCYDMLLHLIDIGYAQKSQRKGVVQFSAVMPEMVADQLKQNYFTFENALPLFHELVNPHSLKPGVRVADSIDGVKNLYKDLLTEKKEILSFIGSEISDPILLDFINRQFTQQRVLKKISQRILSTDLKDKARTFTEDKKLLRKKIKINQKDLTLVCGIHIYGANKIMVNLFHKSEMIAMIIESSLLHKTLHSLFEYVWKMNEKLMKK